MVSFYTSDIQEPFEDLSKETIKKIKNAKYGVDLFLFLNMLMYLPNTEFDLMGKDEGSKHIKWVKVTIHKDLPFVKNGIVHSSAIELSFRVVSRDLLKASKLRINPDKVFISKFSRFLVLPEKYKVSGFTCFNEDSEKEKKLNEYLLYAKSVICNREVYPRFEKVKREEKVKGKTHKLNILKLIYNDKNKVWRV